VEVVTLPARQQRESREAGSGPSQGRRAPRPRSRPRAVERLEKAQDAARVALAAVSSHMQADVELPIFFNRLGKTLARLTGSRRVAFWRLSHRGLLALQPEPFGFAVDSPLRGLTFHLEADGGAAERAFFADEPAVREGTSPELDALWRAMGVVGIRNSIAVPWTVGERRIGALAAYDSRRGFTTDDAWALHVAAMATGLVWRYREAEEKLDVTVERLEVALAARRTLLDNVAAGGDQARRRFASTLHDDTLQLVTAAELQLERIRLDADGTRHSAQLDQLSTTLTKVEGSLRRLLYNVSPEALDLPSSLDDAIRERLEALRIHTGIEPDVDVRLEGELSGEVETVVFRSVAEALTNVEKHAHATRIRVSAKVIDGGVGVAVVDNGTGFVVTESLHRPGHIGLVAMRERVQLAGGWCRLESEPGAGTTVEFWIPNPHGEVRARG
jgi:signal transduction histidine kinase